jgi:hypothetical protein
MQLLLSTRPRVRAVLSLAVLMAALVPRAALAQGALTNGTAQSGAISTIGEIDTWTFTAALGDSIALSIGEVLPGGPDPNFVPYIQLLRPDGTLADWNVGLVAAQIYVNATLSGTYTVLVRDSNINRPGTSTGSYLLHLVKAPIATTDGGTLTSGGNHSGHIYTGDIDAWTFTAALGDYIAVSVGEVLPSETDPLFYPYIRVIGPTGQLVGWDVGILSGEVNFTAPLTGSRPRRATTSCTSSRRRRRNRPSRTATMAGR